MFIFFMFFFQWEPTSPDILIYRKYDKYRYLALGIDMKTSVP